MRLRRSIVHRGLAANRQDLEGRLESLARDELSPEAATLERVREVVMAAARSLGSAESRSRPAALLPARPRTGWRRPLGRLRLAVIGLAAAALVIASVGFAAAQSGPGQPFYHIRLSIEAVGLPPAGSPDRADADVQRAESRLEEMTRAASHGDWHAVADAAGAYNEVVSSLVLPSDRARLTQIHKRLEDQLGRLRGLRATADRSVASDLDRAIDRLDEVVRRAAPSPGGQMNGGAGGAGQPGQLEPGQSGVSPSMGDAARSPSPSDPDSGRLPSPPLDAYGLREIRLE